MIESRKKEYIGFMMNSTKGMVSSYNIIKSLVETTGLIVMNHQFP